jgi:hypothetical protein
MQENKAGKTTRGRRVTTAIERLRNDYLRRVYRGVDGIWYLMTEKHFGFEKAVSLDREVWAIMAKIAARKTKELLELTDSGLFSLSKSLLFRFSTEGYRIGSKKLTAKQLRIEMVACPWRVEILKSKNEALLARVAEICPLVYETWGREFIDDFQFEMTPQICKGGKACRLSYTVSMGKATPRRTRL